MALLYKKDCVAAAKYFVEFCNLSDDFISLLGVRRRGDIVFKLLTIFSTLKITWHNGMNQQFSLSSMALG